MTSYDLALLDAAGNRLPVPTNRAEGVAISTGPRGFQDAQAFIPLTDAQADQLVQAPGLRMKLTDGGGVLWEGRAEDIALRNGGVQIGALGDARLLDDIRYTAVISDDRTSVWVPVTETDIAGRRPSMYTMDTNNRLNIEPTKNTTYAAGNTADLVYKAPNGGIRQITQFVFTYALLTSANFTARIVSWNEGFASGAVEWTLAGTGVLQTGTVTLTLAAPKDFVAVDLTPAAHTYAGENGAEYFRVTGIRVKSSTFAAIYGDDIARVMRDRTNVVNPGALSTSNRLITSPGIDLLQAIYEDAAPSAILDEQARLGDSAGQRYEWGVFEGRELYFRPVGSAARQWAIDAADLDIEQSLEGLINSTYGLYEDANGRKLRTAAQTNAQSIGRYGLTRQGYQEADTTSSATATTIAATATAATAAPIPRATVKVRRFSTLTGAPARGEWVRSGDTVTIRNLPPSTNTAVDRVRTFTVAQTSFTLDTGEVTIIPESPAPDLEFQIAQLLAR